MPRHGRRSWAARLTAAAAAMLLLAGCGGAGAPGVPLASRQPDPATVAPAQATAAPSMPGAAPILAGILGGAAAVAPAGTSWIRVSEDGGTFSIEVPAAWTQHQTIPWNEDDGSTSGSIVVAGPQLGTLGSDFTQPAVAVGISRNPNGLTPKAAVSADDFSGACTAQPAEEANDPTYNAAVRMWEQCGGREGASILALVIQPIGGTALLGGVFQSASAADLGYIEHIFGSIQGGDTANPPGGSTTPAPVVVPPQVTAPPQNSQGYTATIDECLLQMNDAIAIGKVKNTDNRSHAYRVVVRFLDRDGLLLGSSQWDVDALDPGQSGRYEVRLMAINGVREVTCQLSEVLIRS